LRVFLPKAAGQSNCTRTDLFRRIQKCFVKSRGWKVNKVLTFNSLYFHIVCLICTELALSKGFRPQMEASSSGTGERTQTQSSATAVISLRSTWMSGSAWQEPSSREAKRAQTTSPDHKQNALLRAHTGGSCFSVDK